jgi:hypothetical protein
MAQPTTLPFSAVLVYISNTDSPGVYTAPCGFNQKSLTLDNETSDVTVPDCDDPEAAAWIERAVTARSVTVAGSGVLATESYALWQGWGAETRTVRVVLTGLGYWEGDAILQSLGHAVQLGSDGNKLQLNANIISTGAWAWTSVP